MQITAAHTGATLQWGEIYTSFQGPCRRYAHTLLKDGNLAEDVVQDLFLHFLQTDLHPGFIQHMAGFLKKAIRNRCIDQLRRAGKLKPLPNGIDDRIADHSTEERIRLAELQRHYLQAVSTLPAKGREVYRLKTEDALKEKKIARQLNIGVATVQDHLKKSRQNLRARLIHLRA